MFKVFYVLFLTELRTILSARLTIFWVVLFPFFFLIMMMASYGGARGGAGALTIEAVDLDHSPESARYVDLVKQAFQSGDTIDATVVTVPSSAPVPDNRVRFVLPAGFGASVSKGASAPVKLYYNFAGGMTQDIAVKVFSAITVRFNALLFDAPMAASVEVFNSGGLKPVGFAQYMLTGVLIMSIMSSGMSSTCVGIAERRERHTFKFMSCLPMSPGTYLIAMLAARTVVLFGASILLLLGARFIFGIHVDLSPERLLNASIVICLGGVTLLSLGILMSSRVTSVPNAIFLSNMVYLALLFLSNLTMPFSAFPDNVRKVLSNLPTAQFATALRGVLIQGTPLVSEWRALAVLAAWSLGFMVVGRLAFHWHKV
ncbi:MAG: ABC transporter permease [Parvularculaceae bacterium]